MGRLYRACLVVALGFPCASVADQIAVIVHKSVPVEEIEKSELLDLTTGDQSFWSDGSPVVLFDLHARDDVRRAYYRFLGVRSSRVKSIWLKRMLSGDADPPEALASQEEMLERVTTTPGAMGFVDLTRVHDGVRVIAEIEDE